MPGSTITTSPSSTCGAMIEQCYRQTLSLRDPSLTTGELNKVKLDRFRAVQQAQPDSIWAKRANLAAALLLLESEPAEALQRLRAAQPDFPLLDDYLKFWTADALFRLGQAADAAVVFESVGSVATDSLLRARAAYRAGEAWYRTGMCTRAFDPLRQALAVAPHDSIAPTALFLLADCQIREGRPKDGASSLKQLWVRFPNAPEAREAAARLALRLDGDSWQPSADDWLARANGFLALALHQEAVEDYQRFFASAPHHPKRDEARFKLGTALTRLKRYDQAREVYQGLASSRTPLAGEAAVWLGRIYVRQDQGNELQGLLSSLPPGTVSADQRSMILMLTGIWLDDHGQTDKALEKFRQAMEAAEGAGSRLDALWRIGWTQYREGRYQQALESFERFMAGPEDMLWTPQVLYWLARTQEHLRDPRSGETYGQVCRRYPFTYYCQLALAAGKGQQSILVSRLATEAGLSDVPSEIRQHVRYAKAMELKRIGADREAAKEMTALVERYAKDRLLIVELCELLQEAGEHHQALRLARLYFRDPIERGFGDPVPWVLWSAAYPTTYLPTIRVQATTVDPFLAAAIIREESQYDPRALSRVGAVGLMQLMPATAQTLAKKAGEANVSREDLFDEPTNIRFGVRYLDQLLQQFSGNVLYSVAAYNAGPQAVLGWIAKYGEREPDEFVELIPYQETRYYVKRVLRSYREYQRLAPTFCEAASLDKVC